MDAYELHQALLKHSAVETPRPPVFPAEKNHGTTVTNRSRTKEVSSRYKSPTPNATSSRGRSPSPVATRTASSSISVPKRAVSAERRRPMTPPGSGPSTPVQHTNADSLSASRKVSGNRLPESLWPSTLRSLSVSFQSDTSLPIPVSKREKTANHVASDRTLKPSSNVAHKHNESPSVSRKSTPERKRSPLKGKNVAEHTEKEKNLRSLSVSFQSDTTANHVASDRTLRPSSNTARKHNESPPVSRKSTPERKRSPLKGKNIAEHTENSRPIDSVHSRLVEQHRWPSRAGGKVSSSLLNRSIDLVEKVSRISYLPPPGKGEPSLRRLSLDGAPPKSLLKSATDLIALITSDEDGKPGIVRSVDDNSVTVDRRISSRLFENAKTVNSTVRSQSLTTPGSHPASTSSVSRGVSPSRTKSGSFTTPSVSRGVSPSSTKSGSSSTTPSISRGVSPSRTKVVSSTTSSRGSSPARSRPSSPTRQSNPTSVLSFMADIKKGMKAANHFEDVHQLRMLYNRQLQWQYTNALADVSLHAQKEKAEGTLYSAWRTTLDLQHSVIGKRIELNRMRLKSKLCSVLNGQLTCLDGWASIEMDHTETLFQVIKDLQASTLRLPLTAGTRGDVQTVKAAVSSAVDIVEAMGSSICCLLSQAEDMNFLVSEVARIAAQERAVLYECEVALESTLAMQIEECSLRSHLIQLKEAWKSERLVV